ncbi:MAG: MFS transporter [Candidatus Heimdallarchaeota archaeon]|nr:MAG: MFS transporter [Candidatus Heimdallarchaeota archaeon]
MIEPERKEDYENSRLIMASYGFNQFFSQWITGPFGLLVFFFYEVEIGLDVLLVGIAFIIFSLWNAVNDPLTGFIMEHINMPWERKWGKRFPWVVLGAIPWLFTYLAIFLVPLNWDPVTDQWLIFGWALISVCLYDTLFTLWNVNAIALFPDKFRGSDERRTATSFGTFLGLLGIVAGSIVAPLFINEGVPESYRVSAWMLVGIGIILFFGMVPGMFENSEMRSRFQSFKTKAERIESEPFLKTTKRVVTDRRFMVKTIYFFGYQTAAVFISASGAYLITFVIQGDIETLGILMAMMLVGAVLSIPFWNYFGQKINDNKKMSIIAGFVMVVTFLPIFFVNGFLFFMGALLLWGIGLGGQWYMDPPLMGDVLDDLAVRTEKREAALYYGWTAFFIRLSTSVQAIAFAVIHTLTGFVEGAKSYTELESLSATPELALIGIRLLAAILPAVFVLITIVIFWKWYDITPEVVATNKEKLEELGL